MSINLRPRSAHGALALDEAEYEALVRRTADGWSNCETETEWLAKLHYLRSGLDSGKLERSAFEEREARLVLAWLKRLC